MPLDHESEDPRYAGLRFNSLINRWESADSPYPLERSTDMPILSDCDCQICTAYRRNANAMRRPEPPTGPCLLSSWEQQQLAQDRGLPDEPPALEELDGPEDDELGDDMAECVVCGQANERDDMVVPADNYVSRYWDSQGNRRTLAPGERLACHNCVTYCDECGDYYRYISDHRDRYCDSCEEYFCGDAHLNYCDECGESRCENCDDCDCYSGGGIRSYDWQPQEFVMKGDRSQVMMGIELEVTGRENVIVECVHSHDDSEEHLYMKHDGSVNGVEIVTHPGTLEWNRNEFDWAGLLEGMDEAGCRIERADNGLHIHVARDSFTKSQGKRAYRHQMTWLMFLYRNSLDLQLLARRDAGRWCAFNRPVDGELKRKASQIERGDRYVAVNCNNRDTYELRFFAATLDPVEFFAAIEFADASVEYTRQLRASDVVRDRGMSWSAFIDWADKQDGRYSALCAEGRRRVPNRIGQDARIGRGVYANLPRVASW